MHFPLRRSALSIVRRQPAESVRAVDGVNFTIARGESVGLVGESGCGKSTLGRCIVGLYKSTAGEVRLNGVPVVANKRQRNTNPRVAQIIFQDPYSSLNPRMTVRQTVLEALHVHHAVERQDAERRSTELLDLVRLSSRVAHAYPRQLSGGQRQRVSIARAFSIKPDILLCDEPFSALDEFTREEQRRGLLELWQSNQKTILFVTHSVAEAVELSDVIVVMSPQPGRIRAVIPVDLPRPRGNPLENSEAFHAVEVAVRRELRRTWSQPE